jgi:hypothetical protein
VCFHCGDAHRHSDCHWSGQCSRCGKDHKEVVCRKNPNSKLIWEPVVNSSSGRRGNAHMMTGAPSGIQYHTFPAQQLLPAPLVQQYLPAPPMQQYLRTPPSQQILPLPAVASTPGSSHAFAPGGAYYLYGGPIPSTTLTPSSTGFSGPSSSTGISRAYALPSASAAHRRDVVTGIVSIDSFDAFILFDSGASFSFVSKAFLDRICISIQ